MDPRTDVCVLLPTLDEARTVGEVVSGFVERGYENVLVVDGGSTDGTRRIAEEHGARVLVQSGSGKGQAVREGVREADAPVVLMADGDGTYAPADADAMLEPILEGRAEHVIGDRFHGIEPGAMPRLNRLGNRLVNRAFAFIHGRDLVDILSGYRAFTRDSFERLRLTADGFGIETEMAVECVKHGISTEVVGVSYAARPADSETNLRPVRDGARIYLTLFRLAKTNNPLFYFGSVGTAALLVGLGIGAFVAYDWFVNSVSHEALAIVGASGVILGVQLLMFGVLSDVIVAVNREQTRRLEELARRLDDERRGANERLGDDSAPPSTGVDRAGGGGGDEVGESGDDDSRTEPVESDHEVSQ
ncbi:MAG: S-layer glycoprotein N-glycosyltransferase AglJ [Haloarculaceae archaeon]